MTAPSLARAGRELARLDASQLTGELARLKLEQPVLGGWIARKLGSLSDDAARALGASLAVLVWLAMEHASEGSIPQVDARELDNTRMLLNLDEELRKNDPGAAFESEDVVASMQPSLGARLGEMVEEALGEEPGLDVDEADAALRMALVETLALSYALGPAAADS